MGVNAEKLVMDWLADDPMLAGWPVSFDVPAGSSAVIPSRFITVERVGGVEEQFRSMPLIAVQVWAETRWMASQAACGPVLARLKRIVMLEPVAAWDVTGMTYLPMPDGRARYQILIQLTVKSD